MSEPIEVFHRDWAESRTKCALCRKPGPTEDSHIVPAFVARWVKETSATGHLRNVITPNRRIQDYPTAKLLCKDCEERFSVWETYFAEAIFKPYTLEWKGKLPYDGRLLKFALSLSWRVLEVMGLSRETTTITGRKPLEAAQVARRQWRRYLLGEKRDPGIGTHYIAMLGPLASAEGGVPEGFHAYTLRTSDATPISGQTHFGTYVKIPGIVFMSSIEPQRRPGWDGAEITVAGTLGNPVEYRDSDFWNFYKRRAERVSGMVVLSPRQEEKIQQALLRNPERALASKTAEAIEGAHKFERKTETS